MSDSSTQVVPQPKSLLIQPGDMVKFNRGLYHHWGICVAPNQMVHVAPRNGRNELNSLNSLSAGNEAVVKLELIDKWAFECDYCSDNYLDYKHSPKQVDDICAFALEQVDGSFWTYDAVTNNCEKFAIWCRYRINRWGRQGELVRNVTVGAFAVLGMCSLAAVGAAAVAYGAIEAIGGSKHRKNSKRKEIPYKMDIQENEEKTIKLEVDTNEAENEDDDVSSLHSYDSVPVEELDGESSYELMKVEGNVGNPDQDLATGGDCGANKVIEIVDSDSAELEDQIPSEQLSVLQLQHT